jgi:hypothetical protein
MRVWSGHRSGWTRSSAGNVDARPDDRSTKQTATVLGPNICPNISHVSLLGLDLAEHDAVGVEHLKGASLSSVRLSGHVNTVRASLREASASYLWTSCCHAARSFSSSQLSGRHCARSLSLTAVLLFTENNIDNDGRRVDSFGWFLDKKFRSLGKKRVLCLLPSTFVEVLS